MSQLARRFLRKLTLSRLATRLYDRFQPAESFGARGEREAARFLLRRGWILIEAGYQDKFGEIDLVFVDGRTVVFVEVKARTSDQYGSPAEAVDAQKQARLTKTAQHYLKWHHLTKCRARFDVIALAWPDLAKPPEIKHFENAFEPTGKFQIF